MKRRSVLMALAGTAATGQTGPECRESDVGLLCEPIRKSGKIGQFGGSYLEPRYRRLEEWQAEASKRLRDVVGAGPGESPLKAVTWRRIDRGDHIEEEVEFDGGAGARIPAYILIPKQRKLPAPAVVTLHDHGGYYLWGKEKLLDFSGEHPNLTEFRKGSYEGRPIARDLCRLGYVTIAIDAFYWGERRLQFKNDPEGLKNRALSLSNEEIAAFHAKASANEDLVARTFQSASASWPARMLWDDKATVDYLMSRPEVDRARIGAVGHSVGGYRAFGLAALDTRVKVAVNVNWMASLPYQVARHVRYSLGDSFFMARLYRDMDLPDQAAMVAPRALMTISGDRDTLFEQEGVRVAHEKIAAIYRKAGAGAKQAGKIYASTHRFSAEMQADAWAFLKREL